MRLIPLFLILLLLIGCVYPHFSDRSEEVRGRVLDAETRLPVKGARIYFCDPPHHSTRTDANGYFRMKAVKNFHWLAGADGSGYPNPKSNGICISHEGYFLEDFWQGYDKDPMNILLKPNK
jgi:hypothetical protein